MKALAKRVTTSMLSKSAVGLMVIGMAVSVAHAAPKKDAAASQPPRDIQSMMSQRCAEEATAQKVLDSKSAQKFCSCTIGVQANNLKLGEFWAIQSSAMNGKDPRGLPALQRIQPMLDECKKGIVFNTPQAPADDGAAATTPGKP